MTQICQFLNELVQTESGCTLLKILYIPCYIHSSPVTCKKVPTSICESVLFIISLNSLDNKDDILSDDLGVCETDKILVQHPEFRNFTSPRTGLQQSKYGNAYYHINCVALKYPHFQPSLVFIPDNLKRKLNYSDKQLLYEQFKITL